MRVGFNKKFYRLANRCSSRRRLPFFNKVLIATANRDWFKLDNLKIALHCLPKGFQPFFLNYDDNRLEPDSSLQLETEDLRTLSHRGVNLYTVTVYQICVDLQVFINDLDFTNAHHVRAIRKWYRKAASFIDFILPYFHKASFEKVIILQGHLYDSAIIRLICVDRGIPVVAVENTFNKDRIIWDDISALTVNKNLAANFYWRYRDLIDFNTAAAYGTEYLGNIKSKKQKDHRSPGKQLKLDGRRKNIFYIGQVFTDASTLFGISNFRNPVSIIEYLVNFALKENYNLIIKLHPKEIEGIDICQNKYDSLTHRQVRSHSKLYDRIRENKNIYYDYENTYDTYAIIQNADVCVTINSQAGLESLLLGKMVITCGHAFYNCLDSAHRAVDDRHLGFLLNRILKDEAMVVDMEEVYKFFYIFCEKYCLPKTEQSIVSLFEKRINSRETAF